MRATAIVFPGPQEVELREFEPRALREGEVLVETAYTCVSPGTELRALSGVERPAFPVIPGYAIAGRVVQSRSALPEGARLFCAGSIDTAISVNGGGHVSHAIVAAAAATPIPDGVSLLEGSTCILAAIALRGVRLSRPRLGEPVAAIGLGVIGQFAARLHALAGGRVVACDRSAARVAAATAAGVTAVTVGESLAATFAPQFAEGVELIVDATGVPAVLPQAIPLAKVVPLTDGPQPENRYLVQGSYGGEIALPYGEAFRRQLTFLVPKAHQPRDRVAVLELYARGQLRGRDVISAVRRPDAAPATYRELRDPATALLTVAFAWNDQPPG